MATATTLTAWDNALEIQGRYIAIYNDNVVNCWEDRNC